MKTVLQLIFFTFLVSNAYGQNVNHIDSANYPLTKDTSVLYPSILEVKGKIIGVSPGTSCGVACGCGTMKITLFGKTKGYDHSNLFIAIPCFNVIPSDYLNKTIKIKLKILTKSNTECYWNGSTENYFDSKGIPFYIPYNLDEKLDIR
jgi:hypothetical protein